MFIKKTLLLFVLLSLFFVSCKNVNENSNDIQSEESVMGFTIQLPGKNTERAVYYKLDEVELYCVDLVQDSEVLDTKSGEPGDSISFTLDEEGTYTINVYAKKGEKIIATGSTTQTIVFTDGMISLTIKLNPKIKKMDIEVSLEWNEPEDQSPSQITYNVLGGELTSSEVENGDYLIFPIPSRTDYYFIGWYENPDFSSDRVYSIKKNANSIVLYAKWLQKNNISFGDVLLDTGAIIPYTDIDTITDLEKTKVIGVVSVIADDYVAYVLGTHNSSEGLFANYLSWSSDYSSSYITSEVSGCNNWQSICEQNPSKTANAEETFPAFYYACKYADRFITNDNYKSGWYLPSYSELKQIKVQLETINDSLSKVDGSVLIGENPQNKGYWSSSQNDEDSAYSVSFDESGWMGGSLKTSTLFVCVLRSIN